MDYTLLLWGVVLILIVIKFGVNKNTGGGSNGYIQLRLAPRHYTKIPFRGQDKFKTHIKTKLGIYNISNVKLNYMHSSFLGKEIVTPFILCDKDITNALTLRGDNTGKYKRTKPPLQRDSLCKGKKARTKTKTKKQTRK